MNEVLSFFQEVIGFGLPRPPLQEIIFAIGLSFGLNLIIANVYKSTFKGSEFSQDYVQTLLILGTVVSVVVMVVRFDPNPMVAQATAFGIFAAFSIIRFR